MRKLFFVLMLIAIGVIVENSVLAQSKSFEDIVNLKRRGSGVISENGNVRGYYFFYKVEKASKGKNVFLLKILDENLEDFKTTTIEENKNVYLTEGAFNGDQIILKLLDVSEKEMIYLRYDTKGELVSREVNELDKMQYLTYRTYLSQGMDFNSVIGISNKGFAEYAQLDRGKNYSIRFMPTNGGKEWQKMSTNPKEYESATYIANSDDLIFNLVVKRKSATSNKIDFFVNAYDINTGLKAFETELKSEIYSAQPVNAYYDKKTGQFNLVGIYYEADVKAMKDNGLGLFNYKIDNMGNIVNEKYLSWSKDFRKYVTVDNEGRISNEGKNGFIYFHDMIQNEDGSVIAVGEQYNKAVDAAGLAITALGGAASSMKMVIRDMVIFHFSKDFDVLNVDFVEKTKSDFTLPYGYGLTNIHMLSSMVKLYGGFDYSFTNRNKEEGSASVAYIDYEKNKGTKNEFVFGAITYFEGQFTNDKISLGKPKGGSWVRVMPAKPGYVVITEYDKSEKSLDVRLERINY